ncbi:N-acetylglucosaminyl-diphospho-decaprenol L-rhamnosyltransferase [Frigoribacterium sp. Leaf164]|uniref:glycosyltransferase family 2 protein n=1 Tax=Frigoribacterium sp. Leaf164 TaxID=1736282 RepID=UPI0006F9A2F9|nr:glycosyltransferase family 2 protein [Frigoribacterium sp. Leaf164]KQR46510.1 N-acetylglucosaminyl-diphospho-decaprenol L-rhamnosyltransferase [Frigoribacterium sp. Leaf164]
MNHVLGVVTVTHNSGETLRSFLQSVDEAVGVATTVDRATVVVADNDSRDPTIEAGIARAHAAVFVDRRANDGYGAGIDAAVDALPDDVDLVLVSNPDVVLSPSSLDHLVTAADRLPGAASIGPRILDGTGETYPSARALPSLRTGVGHALLGRVWPANPWSVAYKAERDSDRERAAGWLSGACFLVRREAYDAVGGFDHSYFMYFEDVDLGARLGEAGWTNVYVPDAVVTHTGAHSTAQNSAVMERVHHRSAALYLSRRYDSWWLAPLRLALRVGLRARSWWVTRG